jgi:cobalt-zinc-cadmium efflux system outer membrane protein
MVLALATGCVSPTHHLRGHVSGDVLARTGYDLAPPKAACDLVIDQWVDWNDGLSEEEAIVVGLWNNPAYQELLADLQITRADIFQAAQLQNPQVVTMLPVGVKQWEFALNVPLDVLCLRPIRVSAAELESHRVAERLVQDGLNVVRDVRVAFVDWQLAVQQAQLAEQGAMMQGELTRIADARLAAGDVADLDVSAIRLDALVGAGNAKRAARDADLARNRLRYVIGLQLSDIQIRPAPISDPAPLDIDIERLVGEAVSSRPDLRAVDLAVTAAQDRAELARRDIWQLAGILPDINARGFEGFEAGPGLQFSVPLFHQNQGAIAQAEVADEVVGPNFTELWISLDRDVDYTSKVAEIQEVVDGYPGLYRDLLTYLRERVKEVLTGASASFVVRIYGDDIEKLRRHAGRVHDAMANVKGVSDLKVEQQVLVPQIEVRLKPVAAAILAVWPVTSRATFEVSDSTVAIIPSFLVSMRQVRRLADR